MKAVVDMVNKKRRRKRGKALPLEQPNEYYGGQKEAEENSLSKGEATACGPCSGIAS
ncbi:uncharacterized protein BDR25DRAFT_356273 [Lindgomyces ingoldianus]|uniref:Uncharacterized protein n=1 Tax=Lindgomyces ingoldianus TaxID=673940 RepID=A0ACB6QTY9_9PLEO|nr:uncharacterized protein BDR25DRAFT_356273 [Lindgomyces ingoldianus]KAF2469552.1 hypothetical protein BDR25DRAFT_356273 [Lindgomyces ingoldianus]